MESIEEKTSYHEAGHAVAAVQLGGRVHRVSIEPDCDNGPNRYGETIAVWPPLSVAEIYSAEVCVAVAGPVAEMLFEGEFLDLQSVPEWQADWLQALYAATELQSCFSEPATVASIIQTRQQCVMELFNEDKVWAAVAALADELLTHCTLESEQVAEIVGFWSRQ